MAFEKAKVNILEASRLVDEQAQRFLNGQSSFQMALYSFNIMSRAEIVSSMTGALPDPGESRIFKRSLPQIITPLSSCTSVPPNYKNWVEEGKLAPVQNQKKCNNCYIFASVAALESQVAIKYGTDPLKLSEQQLTECIRDPNQPSTYGGCNFGTAEWVYNSTKADGGVVPAASYNAYTATDVGPCKTGLSKAPHTIVDNWYQVDRGDEETLKCNLAKYGPHSISMDFSGSSIINYKSGVFDDPDNECNTTFVLTDGVYKMVKPYNHAVVLVGEFVEFEIWFVI